MRLRLADVFKGGLEGFLSTHAVPPVVGKASRAILNCRTRALGGHAEVCGAGHMRVWYNACRNRACPGCAFYRVQRWLERQAKLLLGCAHHHVIFTVPHELNVLWLLNQAVLGELLFVAARGALFALAADPRYLGSRPGAVMALHTWGQQLALHPHVHCLVTAGGVDGTGRWCHCRRRHFLPAEPLKRLFRGKFLDGVVRLLHTDQLRLPEGWTAADVDQLVSSLWHKRWNVHVRERYQDPAAVLNYLGRYLHGGPIGESRLLAFDGSTVSFRYKDYRVGLSKVMTLPTAEFIRRYLLHVAPKGFHMVRGYGIYRPGGMAPSMRAGLQRDLPISPDVHAALTAHPAPPAPDAPNRVCSECGARIVHHRRLEPRAHAGPRGVAA
jgi:Putative transposase/Transposase zinc-binding domain